MTIWFNDTFTDSNLSLLSAHTSDSGATWAAVVGVSPKIYATSFGGIGVAGQNGNSGSLWRASTIAPSADAVITGNLYVDSVASVSFTNAGIAGRLASSGSAGYLVVYSSASTKWELYAISGTGSTYNLLTSSAVATLTSGSSYTVALQITGSGATVTVNVSVNGTNVITAYADTSAGRATSAGYAGIYLNSADAQGIFFNTLTGADLVVAATAITVSGPSSGTTGAASTAFTVAANGTITGTVIVTPSDSAGGGTFLPTTVPISAGTPTGTFTYTPASAGAKSITVTNNATAPTLTNPAAITYTAGAAGTVPGAPTIDTVTAGAGSARITFTAGTAGSTATLDYTATATPGGATFTGTVSPIAVSGLTPLTSYTFTVHARNTAGASPESAVSNAVIPTAIVTAIPQTAKYADLVRDTSTSTSATTITLSGTAPTGHKAFATAYSVGQKGIPVFYGDTAHGANWMICSCTLITSTSLTVDSIFSSSVGGTTAPTFGAGTKDVFVTVPAVKVFHKDFIDLADYAVDPTFTTDSTAAIQQAILDAYALNITKIRVPCGHYKIAGALVGSGNCQLYIPQTREAAPNKSIYFEGVSPPNFEQQGLRNVLPTTNGVIFESTLVGTGANPAVFGCEQGNSGDSWVWNYTNIGFKNLCVRTFVAPGGGASNSMSAFNFQFAAQVSEMDMLRIDVSRGLQDMVEPSTGSTGIILPPLDNHLLINIGMVYISGYNTAVSAQEHTHIRHFISIGNVNGIVLNNANHGSWIGMMSAEYNKNAIVINGNHDLHIGMYDAEHNSGGNFAYVRDISYITGSRKVSITHSLVVVSSVGISDAAFATNATSANYKILVGSGAN